MVEIIAGARARERGMLALSLAGAGPRPADVQVEGLMCLLAGVSQAMADAHEPLAPELGKTVVAGWLSTINPGST